MTRLWTPAQYLALRVLEIALLDALYEMKEEELREGARIQA